MGNVRSAGPGRVNRGAVVRVSRALALAAILTAAGAAASCTGGGKDSCSDVSSQICDRLAECGSLTTVFTSQEQCVSSFNGYFEVGASDDAACRQTWSESGNLECDAFKDYFQI